MTLQYLLPADVIRLLTYARRTGLAKALRRPCRLGRFHVANRAENAILFAHPLPLEAVRTADMRGCHAILWRMCLQRSSVATEFCNRACSQLKFCNIKTPYHATVPLASAPNPSYNASHINCASERNIMQPTGSQLQRICDALRSAYPTYANLDMFVRLRMDADLAVIVPVIGHNQTQIVYSLAR